MTGTPQDPARPPDPNTTPDLEATRARVRQVVEQQVAKVDSPAAADAVAATLERIAGGSTVLEQQQRSTGPARPPGTDETPGAETTAAAERAQVAGSPEEPATPGRAASVLVGAARSAIAPTPEAPAVAEGVQDVLVPGARPEPPRVRRGRDLLQDAVLKRMQPLQRLDAWLYLAVNGFPHAPRSDRLANQVTVWATGGWIWVAGLVAARLLGARRSKGNFWELQAAIIGATWIVEFPIKAIFRRRRPFVDIVRALVVGKKPGSWSFPSGHSASSFAGALMLSHVWPRRSPIFFSLAAAVGFSRVYVGAHYPGDVAFGAAAGMVLAESIFQLAPLLRRHLR
jgi:membrane-associated phospholipid phosphatase